MSDIKVLALDLDGTLTNDQKLVTPRTRAALDAAGYRQAIPSPTNQVFVVLENEQMKRLAEQKMIFERFYKRSEFSQGVGLGLSICVLIVEKMGGRIELQSEEGRGSRFTVVLPCIE